MWNLQILSPSGFTEYDCASQTELVESITTAIAPKIFENANEIKKRLILFEGIILKLEAKNSNFEKIIRGLETEKYDLEKIIRRIEIRNYDLESVFRNLQAEHSNQRLQISELQLKIKELEEELFY